MPRLPDGMPVRNTIDVDDIDKMIDEVKAAGGSIDSGKMEIPNLGIYVNARDTEGNQFGMLQSA